MTAFISEHLKLTDKLCDRWGKERRDKPDSLKCTLHNMALRREGVVLDGPCEMSDESMLVDRIYLSSPAREKSVLIVWYCYEEPVSIKAKKLNVPRSTLYVVWKDVLSYVRGRLHEFGLSV